VEEVLEQVDELVLSHRELLRLPVRVLHDVQQLAQDRLALHFDEAVPGHAVELGARRAPRLDRNQRVVELAVGEEEGVGVEPERGRRRRRSVQRQLVAELDPREGCRPRVAEHVVVREQEPRPDERAGAVAGDTTVLGADDDAANRPRRPRTGLQERRVHQVVCPQQPLERNEVRRARLDCRRLDRPARQRLCRRHVCAQPGEPFFDALRRVRSENSPRPQLPQRLLACLLALGVPHLGGLDVLGECSDDHGEPPYSSACRPRMPT
jgi:hypothetical protein